MMQLTARMVRAYKGAAASILLLFLTDPRPFSQGEMRRGTGYQDEAIADALQMLREDGLLVKTGRYTWALLTDTRQLPIRATLPEVVDNSVDKPVDNSPEEELAPDDPELALNESMNQSYTSIHQDDSLIDCASSGLTGAAEEPVSETELKALGFYGRGLRELLAIEGLKMGEVRYQVADAPSLGCALARLKKRQPLPADALERAGPDSRNQYIGGEFAEFIQH